MEVQLAAELQADGVFEQHFLFNFSDSVPRVFLLFRGVAKWRRVPFVVIFGSSGNIHHFGGSHSADPPRRLANAKYQTIDCS